LKQDVSENGFCLRLQAERNQLDQTDAATLCFRTPGKSKSKLYYDRQSFGQSLLVSGTHLGPRDQFFLLEFFFRQLRVYYFVAPSLTRGRACNLLYNCFWALPEQSLLGRIPAELRPYFTVSFETPPTWRARSPYLHPPETG
jgi:hypothetical protein